MYNPEQPPQQQQAAQQQQLMAPPRMSFSSDFALEPPPPARPPGRADADFEFSPAGSRPMMDAGQLFSKGRILPLREAAPARAWPPTTTATLRDELRAPDADRGRRAPRYWKELLGLKRPHKKAGAGAAAASAADAHVDLGEHGEAERQESEATDDRQLHLVSAARN